MRVGNLVVWVLGLVGVAAAVDGVAVVPGAAHRRSFESNQLARHDG